MSRSVGSKNGVITPHWPKHRRNEKWKLDDEVFAQFMAGKSILWFERTLGKTETEVEKALRDGMNRRLRYYWKAEGKKKAEAKAKRDAKKSKKAGIEV